MGDLKVAVEVMSLVGPKTGIGQVTKQLVLGLADEPGIDLTGLVMRGRSGVRLDEDVAERIKVKPLRIPPRYAHALWRRGADGAHLRVRGFDVVHGPNYIVPASTGAQVVSIHDLTAWHYPELVDTHCRTYPEHLEKAIARGAWIHAVSNYVADEIRSLPRVKPDMVQVVPNGAIEGPIGDPQTGHELIGQPYVLAIGTVEPRKDYVSLVEAMIKVWATQPEILLVIAGAEGWGRKELDAKITELGVDDKVRRVGYVTELVKADLLAGAEVLAYPSVYEGFGLPLLEAMYQGVPVVSTRAGAIPEVAGKAAKLVRPGDSDELADALLSVIESDDLRQQLIEAGHQRVKKYPWQGSISGFVKLYGLAAQQ